MENKVLTVVTGLQPGGGQAFLFPMSSVPYLKFYPSDWLSEESLRLVSFAARGLWIDLLCLMAKSERRGYLTVNGGDKGWVNPTLQQVARLVGSTETEITPLLEELKQAGTCSVEAESGIIYSRRIVRDSDAYAQAVAYGSKGGNPRLKPRVKGRVNGGVTKIDQPSLGSGFCASTVLDRKGDTGETHAPNGHRKPTWDEWKEHCAQLQSSWPEKDVRSAFNHYEANGWRQNGGNLIREWKAAASNCLRRWKERNPMAVLGVQEKRERPPDGYEWAPDGKGWRRKADTQPTLL